MCENYSDGEQENLGDGDSRKDRVTSGLVGVVLVVLEVTPALGFDLLAEGLLLWGHFESSTISVDIPLIFRATRQYSVHCQPFRHALFRPDFTAHIDCFKIVQYLRYRFDGSSESVILFMYY